MSVILFYVFAALTVGGALGMVTRRNPVAGLLFMVTALASLAGIFVLLEAHFLAAIQVMVYAGAIMVLFLFVIMLLNLGHEVGPGIRRGLGAILSFALVGATLGLLVRQFRGAEASPVYDVFGGGEAVDALLQQKGAVGAIADPIFTDYVVAFELTGILLLVAIVGALALAKRRV